MSLATCLVFAKKKFFFTRFVFDGFVVIRTLALFVVSHDAKKTPLTHGWYMFPLLLSPGGIASRSSLDGSEGSTFQWCRMGL